MPLAGMPEIGQVEPVRVNVFQAGKLDFEFGRNRIGARAAEFALYVEILAIPLSRDVHQLVVAVVLRGRLDVFRFQHLANPRSALSLTSDLNRSETVGTDFVGAKTHIFFGFFAIGWPLYGLEGFAWFHPKGRFVAQPCRTLQAWGAFTRPLSSFPGLKWMANIAGNSTASPVFGLRPTLGWRWCSENPPKPRISIRSPFCNEKLNRSRIDRTSDSISSAGRWPKCPVSRFVNSDRVIGYLQFVG